MLDESGNANKTNKRSLSSVNGAEGEADWIFYGRMKIIHPKSRGADHEKKDLGDACASTNAWTSTWIYKFSVWTWLIVSDVVATLQLSSRIIELILL